MARAGTFRQREIDQYIPVTSISAMTNEQHEQTMDWRDCVAVAIFCVPAALELSYGAHRVFEVIYVLVIALWAWRLPAWSAVAAAVTAAVLLAMTSLESELGLLTTVAVVDAFRRAFVLIAVALLTAQLRRSRGQSHRLARHDLLTGLPNRTLFSESIAKEGDRCRRNGRSLSIAFLDCDHFKNLNDSEGHRVGDLALCVIAKTMHASIRTYDLAARLSGDEFGLLIADATAETADSVTRRVQTQIHDALKAAGWSVSLSVGLVTYDVPESDVPSMIAAADAAMYESKRAGAGGIVVRVVADKQQTPVAT